MPFLGVNADASQPEMVGESEIGADYGWVPTEYPCDIVTEQ
jgi:hypothetical protein